VGAVVRFDAIPASAIMKRHLDRPAARTALLAGGDDYELVFTAARARRTAVARLSRLLRLRLTRVGIITRQRRTIPLVTVLDSGARPLVVKSKGYQHF
jgi:thiamine-monophosphate kinase